MGRKYTNKSEDFFINNSSNKTTLTHMKLPFFKKITFKENINADKKGIPIFAEGSFITNKPIPKNIQVVKIEDVTSRFYNECPNCHRLGHPRIDRKTNNWNYHYQANNNSIKNPSNRPDEYWLCYDHKTKPIKCRVAKFDKNDGILTKKGQIFTKIIDYIFPYCVKPLKRELRDLDSFQKFSNCVHL